MRLKRLLAIGGILCALSMVGGCESSNDLQLASFSNVTVSGSTNYTIKVHFAEDKRVEEKSFDTQIYVSEPCSLVFWEDNTQKRTLIIDQKDAWYSLTTLIVKSDNKPNTEKYTKYSEALDKTYLFNSDKDITMLIRVVIGDAQDNSAGTGKILTNTEKISSPFTVKMKKNTTK